MTDNKKLEDFLPTKKTSYFKKIYNHDPNTIISKEDVIVRIKTVMDPEIPVNLYDLGLIYSININNNNVMIEMTLTNPNCPVASEMPKNVGIAVETMDNLNSVEVKLVWHPKWHKDLMSEDAKLALDIF
tara:strand:+ start:165 stop:551 length:387 start_codon:yes stop_codon:yes gene_type:complete